MIIACFALLRIYMKNSVLPVERKGELFLFLSSVVFTVITLLVKVASSGFSGMFVATWRFIVGIIATLIVCKTFGISTKIENRSEWFIRGVFGAAAMVSFYFSIQLSTISRAALLCNTSPIFVAVFGFLFFKESIRRSDIASLLICFLGVVFIFYDRGTYSIKGDILGLLSSIFSGIAIHYVKKSSMVNHSLVVYLSPCLIGLLFIPFTIHEYQTFNLHAFYAVLVVGVLTVLAQFFMTSGYRCVNPTRGSVLNYLQIPLTLMLGAFFTHDPFPLKFIIGMVLILTGLMINIFKITRGIKEKTVPCEIENTPNSPESGLI
jgi:drug/metabolite transporter (DMT)-like permease